ncbi:hypothetical protein [Nocardia sp. NPDC052316]|uniref:hypothetical protein n=1 Tax=Nocardia sp. NPDC052316 TaxID=3364329 RepID=UPI0037C5474C
MADRGPPENVAEQLSAADAHASGLLRSRQAVYSALARLSSSAAAEIVASTARNTEAG